MAEVLPQIRVRADAQSREASSMMDTYKSPPLRDATNGMGNGRVTSPENVEARHLPNTKTYPSKFIQSLSGNQATAASKSPAAEERRDSQAIDPLSHAILNRTNTTNILPPKMRSGASEEDHGESETGASVAAAQASLEPIPVRYESAGPGSKDKRNRVSFFSRFAPKKKDVLPEINDDESEAGNKRTEGMDAEIFSQPIGYIPQFPPPPKYIKVRSHGKKDKDFQRLFLAQELRGRSGVEIAQSGGRLVKNGAYKHGDKDGNAIWAMEFSKGGKHLAAGGKDYVVRVWAVLSTKEERQAHEKEEDFAAKAGESIRLNAPVFRTKTVQEYEGHTASILDLSWSKNNFLLSSSMDKTVRLWHVSRAECLCCFKHSDFVTSIQFHPRDDRFFLAGSLDSKLRLWSIPDKSVAYWSQTPDLITAVAFAPDGKTAIAGCLNGLCLFYETEGLKYQTQIHVRSAHGKNAKGSKVTGIQAINYPPEDPNGEVKLLITSNDSRVRVYNLRDKGLELKLKGNENSCSQIHASFSDDAQYIICGSEDRKAYIWSTGQPETEKDKRSPEIFEAHSAIVTSAIMASTKTRQLLSASSDPLYDLCNPPPVTLISRSQSHASSIPPSEGSPQPDNNIPSTSATPDISRATKPEESPAYLARCAHPDGNIIVTADFMGHIKVFRQDCAYQNRLRNKDSALSKKMLGRTNSVATKNSRTSRRDSLQMGHPSSERILSWRQSISSNNGSIDNFRLSQQRSSSPRKSFGAGSLQSARHPSQNTIITTPSLPSASQQPSPHRSSDESRHQVLEIEKKNIQSSKLISKPSNECDPLMLRGEQSYMFWNSSVYQAQAATAYHLGPNYDPSHHNHNGYSPKTSTAASSNRSSAEGHHAHLGVPMAKADTRVSRLSSGEESGEESSQRDEAKDVTCRRCGGKSFRVTMGGNQSKPTLECGSCGEGV